MVRSLAYAAFAAAVLATPGYASTVSGTFSGTVSAPYAQTSATISHIGSGTNSLEWGTPSGPVRTVESGNASSLTVNSNSFSINAGAPGDVFIGSITWENQSNWHIGGTWNSILSLSILLNTAGGPVLLDAPLDFTLENTTDFTADTAHNEATGERPDTLSGLVLGTSSFALPVSLGHGLSLTGLSFRLSDAGTPGTAWNTTDGFMFDGQPSGSRFDATTGFWENREGGISTLDLYAMVEPVPLPAAFWLLLSGFGSVLLIKRRRTSTV